MGDVSFSDINQGVSQGFSGVGVLQSNLGADRRAGHFGRRAFGEDLGVIDAGFQFADAEFDDSLLVLGCVQRGVFPEILVSHRPFDIF